MSVLRWWRSGPPHRRLRRRLVSFSAPVAVALVVVAIKAASVGVAGHSAAADFASDDVSALRDDVATLSVWNVAEPGKAFFAAGALAVLEDRLEDADRQFSAALARTGPSESCPVRVNLELIRETLGDRAAGTFDTDVALERYRAASSIVSDAPGGCFAANTDADEQRRALRDDAASRLDGKIAAAQSIPPAAVQIPAAIAPPPPPPPAGSTPSEPDPGKRLNPQSGDPSDRLQQILRDAAEAGDPSVRRPR